MYLFSYHLGFAELCRAKNITPVSKETLRLFIGIFHHSALGRHDPSHKCWPFDHRNPRLYRRWRARRKWVSCCLWSDILVTPASRLVFECFEFLPTCFVGCDWEGAVRWRVTGGLLTFNGFPVCVFFFFFFFFVTFNLMYICSQKISLLGVGAGEEGFGEGGQNVERTIVVKPKDETLELHWLF